MHGHAGVHSLTPGGLTLDVALRDPSNGDHLKFMGNSRRLWNGLFIVCDAPQCMPL